VTVVASSFKNLRDFIQKRMRMSHIYQPVMIRELLKRGGKASIRNIAAAFLARDASQLEYYEQITKNMPGKVLGKHGIAERDGDEYRLTVDQSSLSSKERDELIRLCDEAISAYEQKRERLSTITAGPPWATSRGAYVTKFLNALDSVANYAGFRQMREPLRSTIFFRENIEARTT
jgi:hypothetical protein